MDVFDVIIAMLFAGPSSGRQRPREENIGIAIATCVLPLIDLGLILLPHLKHPALLCLVLPVVFGGAACVSSRLLDVKIGYAVSHALACAFLCFLLGSGVVVLTVMTWGY